MTGQQENFHGTSKMLLEDVWVTCSDIRTAAMYGDSETLFSYNNPPRHTK